MLNKSINSILSKKDKITILNYQKQKANNELVSHEKVKKELNL